MNNYDFDFGIGSNRSRSLNDRKNPTTSSFSSSSFASTQSKPNTTSSWQPRPSWTHQPVSNQPPSAPTSMVGDIFGKSWGSPAAATPSATTASIGIVNNKNPNLFGDLVSSAIGQNKGNSNVPLKNATPVSAPGSNKGPFSMGNMADSLPKTGDSGSNWGSSKGFGGYTGGYNSSGNSTVNNNMKSVNLGGPSMKSGGGGMGLNKDPFGSLVDFGSKSAGGMNFLFSGKGNDNKKSNSGNDAFGNFQNASKSSTPAFAANPFPEFKNNSMGSNSSSYSKMDDFAIPTSQNQPPVQSSGVDAFDSLFTSSSASAGAAPKGSEGVGSQQFSGADDWGMDSEFGGGKDMGGTTELEGLPPPPAGVSASAAKNKGMDNYKQGQYADAIKWLSWAVILLEKTGGGAASMEVLSSRASCYKEVGEYKKAVADCTKVLEHDGENVAVLVQRALLYESMEKYKLGAEDLRTVMKIDPGNRVARSTVHRLTKMAG
ncbi:uncharacterized transmembrane protein DDB_G0289901-like [Camellia sinensis]|uniref:uncharacterized transmembrane protein DDB_G0289901-like n=1 Tax=Camellia sinensis TaxID=4442 RepID=UPI001035D603|nr:uncharacterized transmembrane protein DDB_G0289901-like [Camellia sinensis]XP_028119730.1 uncharacterized transmembrane protein DDB_G0289901-like [Camellia sinensis]